MQRLSDFTSEAVMVLIYSDPVIGASHGAYVSSESDNTVDVRITSFTEVTSELIIYFSSLLWIPL